MLVKQRDLLALHKPPESRDKLREHDVRVSEAAGALFGDKASLLTARYRLSCLLQDCRMFCLSSLLFESLRVSVYEHPTTAVYMLRWCCHRMVRWVPESTQQR
jgi:hypothetical protein